MLPWRFFVDLNDNQVQMKRQHYLQIIQFQDLGNYYRDSMNNPKRRKMILIPLSLLAIVLVDYSACRIVLQEPMYRHKNPVEYYYYY